MEKIGKNLIKLKKDMIDLIKLFNNIEQINFNYVSATNNIIMLLFENENIYKGNFEEKLSEADIEYIREIFSSECLTFKEMNNYIKSHDMSNYDLREFFIDSSLWVSAYLSLNYIGNGIDYIDLVQQGYFGIENAIEKNKKSYTTSFSTLIKEEIIASLMKYVREFGKYGHISNKQLDICLNLDSVKDKILNDGHEGNLYEIADYLNYPVDSLEDLILKINNYIDDIDGELNCVRNFSSVVDFEEKVIKDIDCSDIIDACDLSLNDREKYVIYHYYGINNCRSMNYAEIGECLGCSSERIRQILCRAFHKIRIKYQSILYKRNGLLSINDVKELRKNKITF